MAFGGLGHGGLGSLPLGSRSSSLYPPPLTDLVAGLFYYDDRIGELKFNDMAFSLSYDDRVGEINYDDRSGILTYNDMVLILRWK